jgi:hypothetical protein
MIGKAIIGNSFNACINYCLAEEKEPQVLASHGVFGESKMALASQFNTIKSLRPGVKKAVWHSAISFAPDDLVSEELMVQIAKDYLSEMKLQEHQYLMVRHNDTDHEHLHIIVNRVGFDGAVMRDWKSGYRTKKVMQKLELKYELVVAEQQGNRRKQQIAEQIEEGLSRKEPIDQIFGRVEGLGYRVQYNKTSTGNIRGVSFIDEAKGILFKSSAIKREYSYAKLSKATIKHQLRRKTKNLHL